MRYAASLNAGLGGLMRSIWAQPQGNGTLDAMKVAEGESTIAKNNAGIGKDNAETDKITRRLRDMYDPQFQQDVSAGMLPTATPEQRAAATVSMLRLTDNPQHLTDSFGKGLDQANYQRALDEPNFAPNFNRANAAKDGKMYSNVGDSGLVLSQANGLQGVGNQEQYTSQLAKTIAETGRANAQTGQANSAVRLNNSRANQPQNAIGYDAAGSMVLVDKKTGKLMPVGDGAAKVTGRPVPKLPAATLKQQQELVEAIGSTSSLNARLNRVVTQIETGKLDLGPISRAVGYVQNQTNSSTENSRNLSGLKAVIEELRNQSLRLNAGVQTDGDAKRAWEEIAANPNDSELVKERLKYIIEKNNEATKLKKLQIEQLRQNFNQPQLQDYGDGSGLNQQDGQVFDFNDLPE